MITKMIITTEKEIIATKKSWLIIENEAASRLYSTHVSKLQQEALSHFSCHFYYLFFYNYHYNHYYYYYYYYFEGTFCYIL